MKMDSLISLRARLAIDHLGEAGRELKSSGLTSMRSQGGLFATITDMGALGKIALETDGYLGT